MSFFDWVRGTPTPAPAPAPAATQVPTSHWDVDIAGRLPVNVRDRVVQIGDAAPCGGGAAAQGQPEVGGALASWYASQGFIGHQLAALMAQHWLVLKACAMPARDAVRNGWRVVAEGEPLSNTDTLKIKQADDAMGIKRVLQEWLTKGRIFGVRIAIPDIEYEDPKTAWENPFNPDGVRPGSFKGWIQVDPYWCIPESPGVDPAKPGFYEPTYWVIQGQRYHKSHLVIYRHGQLADYLKPSYLYGGIPLPQLIAERVYGAERSANECPLLVLTKRTVIYKTDLERALSNWERLQERTRQFIEFWNNNGIRVIDKESDEHQQFDTALGDVDSLVMSQYQLVSAVAEVPATKLLGTSPKGFNATGEHEQGSYHESLESIQENDLQRLLSRHYLLMAKSLQIDTTQTLLTVAWQPLAVPTYADQAAARAAGRTALGALVTAGIVDVAEARQHLAQDEDFAAVITQEKDI